MKERPIIMSGKHPRLIIDGTKTQSRRVIKPQPYEYKGTWVWAFRKGRLAMQGYWLDHCPYGQVGDRLWVKETWRVESFMDGEPLLFGYKDGQTMEENEYSDTPNYESWYERVCIQSTEEAEKAYGLGLVNRSGDGCYYWSIGKSPCHWRPSIFMPRWASRILLEITEVRVERVQEISESDVRAEGLKYHEGFGQWYISSDVLVSGHKTAFQILWDSLNAKRGYGWEVNPWVWVISFKVVK